MGETLALDSSNVHSTNRFTKPDDVITYLQVQIIGIEYVTDDSSSSRRLNNSKTQTKASLCVLLSSIKLNHPKSFLEKARIESSDPNHLVSVLHLFAEGSSMSQY